MNNERLKLLLCFLRNNIWIEVERAPGKRPVYALSYWRYHFLTTAPPADLEAVAIGIATQKGLHPQEWYAAFGFKGGFSWRAE